MTGPEPAAPAQRGVRDELTAAVVDRIRARRGELDLSVQELADRVGVAHSTLSAIEHGHRGVTLPMLARIAAAFGDEPWMLIPKPCPHCGDRPPAGFTCNTCQAVGT